ncbi:MAG: hypothetical protein QM770_20530 [Tepidisphaeraceae bacterium]
MTLKRKWVIAVTVAVLAIGLIWAGSARFLGLWSPLDEIVVDVDVRDDNGSPLTSVGASVSVVRAGLLNIEGMASHEQLTVNSPFHLARHGYRGMSIILESPGRVGVHVVVMKPGTYKVALKMRPLVPGQEGNSVPYDVVRLGGLD